jgi:hypothetical protein
MSVLGLFFKRFRRLTEQDLAVAYVQWWAGRNEMEVVALEPCRKPPLSVLLQFSATNVPVGNPLLHYFRIGAIDVDHVRHWGVTLVHHEIQMVNGTDVTVSVAWLTSEQLDWRARSPRLTAKLPHARAQGWYTDPTRAHELRWYSAGTPTDLVKDGAVESRDPPAASG